MRWSPHIVSRVYRLSSWSYLNTLLLTHFGLQIFKLYFIADDGVGLGHVLGVNFVMYVLGVNDLSVGGEEVLVDVLVELLRSRWATLMLLMLIR